MPRQRTSDSAFRRARRLRMASRVALGLWVAAWIAFGLDLGKKNSSDTVSGLAVVICVLFALGLVLEGQARRIERRELALIAAREDVTAARSRGLVLSGGRVGGRSRRYRDHGEI